MRHKVSFLIPLCSAVLLMAAASWQKKDFSQWTEDDAKKVLTDSPWSKQVAVSGGTSGMQGEAPSAPMPSSSPAPSSGGSSSQSGSSGQAPSGGGTAAPSGGGMSPSSAPAAPETRVLIEWESATPVRLAELKSKPGNGQVPANEIETAKKPVDSYVVAVIGVPGTPQPGEEKQLASAATLVRKGKEPIQASSAKVQQLAGSGGSAIIFNFPKNEPITLDDKSVEFRLAKGLLPSELRKNFGLKDMQYQGKLDL
jgi:hypothetical protein